MPRTIPPDHIPTLDEVRGWPATVDVATACQALGISRSYGYELVRRGELPVRVLAVGGRYRVITATLLSALGGGGATA